MALPNSYLYTIGRVEAYFDAIANANPPDRFTFRFLEALEFKSSNDRLLIGVLKDLGFIDQEGVPKQRYFEYLDRSQSSRVLADAIRDAYADLFDVYKEAHKLSLEEVKNKLRTLYAGSKTDEVIARIASTFSALCGIADFSHHARSATTASEISTTAAAPPPPSAMVDDTVVNGRAKSLELTSLQYHINIVLPESRDQAVYDAIFRSMREHLS